MLTLFVSTAMLTSLGLLICGQYKIQQACARVPVCLHKARVIRRPFAA